MLERIKARFQNLTHYIRTRDVQYWKYRIAGPARFAFVGNLILLLILANIDIIPPEMQPPFILSWFEVQVILAAISIGASLMTFNKTGRVFIGVLMTLILLGVIGYLLLR
ncbi:MAG: hypothetical protein ACFFEA_07770 [Candidatus Thorarchaeota archaeon]